MLLSLLLHGCPGGDDTGTPTGDACAALDVTTCASRADCAVIDGRELSVPDTGGASCYNLADPSDLGCHDAQSECTSAETFAAGPDGVCHWFNNGCIPTGWVDCYDAYQGMNECP